MAQILRKQSSVENLVQDLDDLRGRDEEDYQKMIKELNGIKRNKFFGIDFFNATD